MEVKVGDRVRFLNDVGGGRVTKIIDRQKVMVLNNFDFEVPVAMSELVVIEKAGDISLIDETFKSKAKPTNVEIDEPEEELSLEEIFYPEVTYVKENGNDLRVYFAFVPQGRPGNSDYEIYLINDSNYNAMYSIITCDADDKYCSEAVGVLEANTKEQVSMVSIAHVNQMPAYICHLVFYQKGVFIPKAPVVKNLEINPVKFYKENSFQKNDFFPKGALLFALIDEKAAPDIIDHITHSDFKKIITQKEKTEKKKEFQSPKGNQGELMEVDLHIHELLDDFRGLSNSEMVEIQMNHFHQQLNEAIKKGIKRIVFIHGVGAGTLKLEIRKELDRLKNKLDYQDASFKEYGYGATMVRLF
jgi:hypothetical protein